MAAADDSLTPRPRMGILRPFRALRYDPQRAGDLSRVLAPPYDVIGPAAQDALHAASPYNVVRLILGRTQPGDTDADNVYTRARRTFDAWWQDGILRRDDTPAFYLVEHSSSWEGRTYRRLGVLGLLDLEEAGRGGVLRHEHTLAGPRADRTRLLEALPANLSPIFCIAPDPGGRLQTLVQEAVRADGPATTAAIGEETVRVWLLADAARIRDLQAAAEGAFLIADGHHRFEVAWSHRDRYTAVMTYLVSMQDPGLLMRAIHRVITAGSAPSWDTLAGVCTRRGMRTLEDLRAWLAEPTDVPGRFGYAGPDGLWAVTLTDGGLATWMAQSTLAAGVARLDVSILHGFLLRLQGLPPEALAYSANAAGAAESVRAGQAAGAWLLRPLAVTTVYQLAAEGVTLPPKSTFFFPKVPSGLAFNPFDPAPSPVR